MTLLTEPVDYVDRSPSWSPDGSQIIFSHSEPHGSADIFVINANASGLEQITGNSEPSNYPAWSPEGDRIAYTLGGIINIYFDTRNE